MKNEFCCVDSVGTKTGSQYGGMNSEFSPSVCCYKCVGAGKGSLLEIVPTPTSNPRLFQMGHCYPKTLHTWGGGLSKSFISRVIIGATPFRALITLLRTYLLSPMPLQAGSAIDYTKPAFLKIPSPGSKLWPWALNPKPPKGPMYCCGGYFPKS